MSHFSGSPNARLLTILAVQAVLLVWNLDLLPIWTDELFTLQTAQRSIPDLLRAVAGDIHPPLYYVLSWMALLLPTPDEPIVRLRLLSVLWTLICTVLLHRFWWRRLRPSLWWTAALLWCLSPCVLLYGRMARSYLMQVALAIVAIQAVRWFRRRSNTPRMAASAGVLAALLYTHYVPGLAILGAANLCFRRTIGLRRLAAWNGLIAVAYLPWMMVLAGALSRWWEAPGTAARHMLTGNPFTEQVLKLGYAFTSFSIGETFPPPALLLLPVVALVWLRGPKSKFVLVAGAIGYIGVARWVSYPFVPARLLWLLPFFLLTIALSRRRWMAILLITANIVSIACYFTGSYFLNKGYISPIREVAALIPAGALVLADPYNTDSEAFRYYAAGRFRVAYLTDPAPEPLPAVIWVLRNTRDLSPGGSVSQTEIHLCAGRDVRVRYYLPLASWERTALRILGTAPPEYFYRLTQCTAPED